ncbi:MAG: energy-coupling factor ABC transporter ATP-binding protein [Oscillospiraceae bacterium]|jgi:cobalt/nickel transport system ATP-binding protein|nr:energy-coupling factor ABC transporter ATP-binding protein [Oscillospiraceae bacterium]
MLNVNNLSVSYPDGTEVLRGVSFTLKRRENAALIGANGAGKTSLLLSLSGILGISGGNADACGVALGKQTLGEYRRSIGLVFQNPDDQLFMPSIFEDIAFGPRNLGVPEAEIAPLVQRTLESLGIAHLSARSPLKLSGGEKRLCALATTLAMEPEFLLLDEPTAFLDPKARHNLAGLLNRLPQGKLIATHDLSFARLTCSRVLLLSDGEVSDRGAPTEATLSALERELVGN